MKESLKRQITMLKLLLISKRFYFEERRLAVGRIRDVQSIHPEANKDKCPAGLIQKGPFVVYKVLKGALAAPLHPCKPITVRCLFS